MGNGDLKISYEEQLNKAICKIHKEDDTFIDIESLELPALNLTPGDKIRAGICSDDSYVGVSNYAVQEKDTSPNYKGKDNEASPFTPTSVLESGELFDESGESMDVTGQVEHSDPNSMHSCLSLNSTINNCCRLRPTSPYIPKNECVASAMESSVIESTMDEVTINITGPNSSDDVLTEEIYNKLVAKMFEKGKKHSPDEMDLAKMAAGFNFAITTALAILHFEGEQPKGSSLQMDLLILGFAVSFFTSFTAVVLRRNFPIVAKIMEKLGSFSMVLTFFALIGSKLPKNLMWVASPFCVFLLCSIAIDIFKMK